MFETTLTPMVIQSIYKVMFLVPETAIARGETKGSSLY